MSTPVAGAEPRLDRGLRITAGVLGLVVAVPSFLAFAFVVLLAWVGSGDTPLWLAVPLGMLAIGQLYLSIRTLSARLATAVAVGLLGVLELAVGVFVLVGSPTLLPATIAAIVVVFIAGVVALAVAVRMHLHGPRPQQSPPSQVRVGRKRTNTSDAPRRTGDDAGAKPAPRPTGAQKGSAKAGSPQQPGGKKSARKR